MTHRDNNRESLIVPSVVAQKGAAWSDETRKVAQTDAQRVLEAMVAELGVNGAVRALDAQGFKGSAYRYLLNPLFDEAHRRRLRVRDAERRQANTTQQPTVARAAPAAEVEDVGQATFDPRQDAS